MIKNGTALLIERNTELLTESEIIKTNDDKKYIISGIFMQADIKNRNGRIYPAEYMDKEAQRYINEKILTNTATGELNHPTGEGSLSIDYERVSHKITSLVKSGSNWVGEAVITHKTPKGALVAGLLDAGIVIGVSSRATGSLKLNGHGTKIVQSDFRLITPADIVSDPSAPDAFMTAIMEGHEWIFENGTLTEQAIDESRLLINENAKAIKDEERLIAIFDWIVTHKVGK